MAVVVTIERSPPTRSAYQAVLVAEGRRVRSVTISYDPSGRARPCVEAFEPDEPAAFDWFARTEPVVRLRRTYMYELVHREAEHRYVYRLMAGSRRDR